MFVRACLALQINRLRVRTVLQRRDAVWWENSEAGWGQLGRMEREARSEPTSVVVLAEPDTLAMGMWVARLLSVAAAGRRWELEFGA